MTRGSKRALSIALVSGWECVCGLFLMDIIGRDLGLSLGIAHISWMFLTISMTQTWFKGIPTFFVIFIRFIKSHIKKICCFRFFLNLYTNYTDKISSFCTLLSAFDKIVLLSLFLLFNWIVLRYLIGYGNPYADFFF
jgi:hypothetical protein